MKPPYIPFNPRVGHVRARKLDVSGPKAEHIRWNYDLEVSRPQAGHVQARGQTCPVILVRKKFQKL
jgi:hypothetical protein